MSHLLALALLGVDCLVRAWRIQLSVWTAGRRLSFGEAFRLNLYGEAASQLTPNRLGGEPARFLGLAEARLRPVTALVAIGVEGACEWPVFVIAAAALVAYYVPDWQDAARTWLQHHRAGELVTIEITVLLVLVAVYLFERLARSGFVRHRVRRQWRVAWAHVRRAPRWALGAGALLTVVSLAARALILPALAWGLPDGPPFGQMFFGALALDQAPPEVAPIFETYLKERGNIPNMFRTVALRSNHLRTMIAHFRTVMNEGTVPRLLKELLWVRISHLNGCRY